MFLNCYVYLYIVDNFYKSGFFVRYLRDFFLMVLEKWVDCGFRKMSWLMKNSLVLLCINVGIILKNFMNNLMCFWVFLLYV